MILQNVDKSDSKVILVEGRALIVGGGKNVKVPNDIKYNRKDFKKVVKVKKARRYEIIIKGKDKRRGDLLKTTS